MNTDKLKELVNNSELSQVQKNIMNGFVQRASDAQDKKSEDRLLIEQVAHEKHLSQIVLSTDEVKIYTVNGSDKWDIENPYRSIFVGKKGTWERSGMVSPSLDTAFLVYLQTKHLGFNSQFADFAIKMLEIDLIKIR